MDYSQRIEALRDLMQYYHKPVNSTVLNAWLKHCAVMSDEDFNAAVEVCLLERSQMPTISEFQELPFGDSEAMDRLSLEQAWQLVIEGSRIATSRSEEHIHRKREIQAMLSESQYQALQTVGGFIGLGATPNNELHWRKRDFMESYKVHKEGEKAIQRSQLYLLNKPIPDSLKPYEGEDGDRDDGMDHLDDLESVSSPYKAGLGSIRDVLNVNSFVVKD